MIRTVGRATPSSTLNLAYWFLRPLILIAELTTILAADLVYDFLNVLASGVDGKVASKIESGVQQHEEL